MLAYCWNALNISFINVFSSCSEIYSSEEYTSALSKLIRLVVRRSRAFTFRNAVFMFEIPSLLNSSFSRSSSKGALISVNGVRISCAVLIKKCIFSSETLRCFLKISIRNRTMAMRQKDSCINQHGPECQPERLGYDNIHTSFFKHDAFVFIGDGTYP